MDRVGQQGVAQQNGDISAITPRHRGLVATQIRPVHDIVMNQRGEMDHFHHGRRADQRGRGRPRLAPAAEENQRRPDALAGDVEAILHGTADLRLETAELGSQKVIQLAHLRLKTKEEVGKTLAG